MTEPDIRAIMTRVVVEILTDRHLSFPWYQAEIRSEAEAQTAALRLPLICHQRREFVSKPPV